MTAKITIRTAPAASGKSNGLIEQIGKLLREGKGGRVLMLVPTAADARTALHSLMDVADGIQEPPVANFYELVARILDSNRRSGREISHAERDFLLEHTIENLAAQGKIKYFAPLLGFRGLAPSIGGFIKELKQNTIYPEQFLACSKPGPPQKGAEISAIYAEYQRILKAANLYDTEGKLWLVRDLIMQGARKPYEEVEKLFIDDFADFTPSEFDIIKAFARHVKAVTFTLTHEDGERRGELFGTTSATIALIEREFPGAKRESAAPSKTAGSSLAILRQNLFDPLAEQQDTPDDGIHIIRCPDRSAEVTETGRKIKDLLLEGRKAEEIAVIVRSPADYAPLFEEVFREQGIPFSITAQKKLGEIPVVKSIMHLLEIPGCDYSRHAVMRFLGSVYARAIASDFDTAKVDRVSREAQVISGANAWRARIRSHVKRLENSLKYPDIGEDLPEADGLIRSRLSDAKSAAEFLEGFFKILKDFPKEATFAEYTGHVLKIANLPRLRQACINPSMPENTGEDIAAPAVLRVELRRLAAISEVLGIADRKVPYHVFLEHMRRLTGIPAAGSRVKPEGRVRIMEVSETRGMFFPIVFVCGLMEKEFPRQIPQSPFYNDAARKELNRSGKVFLSERGAGQKFEMFLFYTAVTRATERLFITHPMVDSSGREALPSYYLSEVERLFAKPSIERISPGQVLPPHEDAVCAREMLAAALADGIAANAKPEEWIPRYLRPLSARAMPSLNTVAHGLEVTRERNSFKDYGIFDGVIKDPRIREQLEARVKGSILSAGQMGRYGSCPFMYFTERVLGLAEITEPEDELTSIDRGKFFHALLRDFFTALREKNSTVITKENEEHAAGLIEQLAREHFERIKKSGAVANEVVFKAEQSGILDELRAFVAKEAGKNSKDKTRTEPAYFELAFGFDKMQEKWDPASTHSPLVIEGGEFTVKIRGVIDRVDRIRDGTIVIDYKGSRASTKSAYINGSDFQIPLYAIAVNELFADEGEVADGFYYPLKSLKQAGRLQHGNPQIPDIYDVVKRNALRHVAAMCKGRFPPDPKDDSRCKYCAARGMCRYSEARAERKTSETNGSD